MMNSICDTAAFPIQHGTKGLLFGAPSIHGGATFYRNLLPGLGPEYTLFGFNTPGVQFGQTPPRSIEQVARIARNRIIALKPEQCCILGYSMGGKVAFELARQLRDVAISVPVVAMFDTTFNDASQWPDDTPSEPLWFWELFAEVNLHGKFVELRSPDHPFWTEDFRGKLRIIIEFARSHDSVRVRRLANEAQLIHAVVFLRAQCLAMIKYVPEPSAQRILYFEAAQSAGSGHAERWRRVCTDEFEVIRLEGDHTSILYDPVDVAVTGAALASRIEHLWPKSC